jgi:hypothetical protein
MKAAARIMTTLLGLSFGVISFETGLERWENGGEREGRSGALQALEFWTDARAFPKADIPDEKYYLAFLEMNRNMRSAEQVFGTRRNLALPYGRDWRRLAAHRNRVPGPWRELHCH